METPVEQNNSILKTSIREFVGCLADINKDKYVSLLLYERLLKTGFDDNVAHFKKSFETFFQENKAYMESTSKKDINRDAVIRYKNSEKIYIPIGKIISMVNVDVAHTIKQHLFTINALLDPSEQNIEAMGKALAPIQNKSAEFIDKIMGTASESLGKISLDAGSEELTKQLVGVMNGGLIQEMVSGLQSGLQSGELDLQTMMSAMISKMMKPDTSSPPDA